MHAGLGRLVDRFPAVTLHQQIAQIVGARQMPTCVVTMRLSERVAAWGPSPQRRSIHGIRSRPPRDRAVALRYAREQQLNPIMVAVLGHAARLVVAAEDGTGTAQRHCDRKQRLHCDGWGTLADAPRSRRVRSSRALAHLVQRGFVPVARCADPRRAGNGRARSEPATHRTRTKQRLAGIAAAGFAADVGGTMCPRPFGKSGRAVGRRARDGTCPQPRPHRAAARGSSSA